MDLWILIFALFVIWEIAWLIWYVIKMKFHTSYLLFAFLEGSLLIAMLFGTNGGMNGGVYFVFYFFSLLLLLIPIAIMILIESYNMHKKRKNSRDGINNG